MYEDETIAAIENAAEEYGWGTSEFANELSANHGFESSDEILRAIGEICTDAEDFQLIWENPDEEEYCEVVIRALELANLDDEDELDWGVETFDNSDLPRFQEELSKLRAGKSNTQDS